MRIVPSVIQLTSCLAVMCLLTACDQGKPKPQPAVPPPAPVAEQVKPAAEPAKPAAEPAKPTAQPATPAAEPAKPAADPARTAEPAAGDGHATPPAGGSELKLEGLTVTVPEGWVPESVDPGPMAPVAIFALPKVEGDSADCGVRISYYPGMKGKDEMNLDRWLSQGKQADGKPHTKESAKLTTTTIGHVRLTTVDMVGTLNSGMGMGEMDVADTRMIAAIVDHPRGPHYVKVFGPVKSMEKWAPSIDAFLKSSKAVE